MSASSPLKTNREEAANVEVEPPSGPSGCTRMLVFLVVVAEVFVMASLILVGIWMGNYRGGFAWTEDPRKEFNYHPLFMIMGLVLFYGNAILSYRTAFRNVRKLYGKIVHAGLLGCTAIFWGVGLRAAFDSHNLVTPPIPNLYTVHSWLGLMTVILFGIQWLVGFVSFLLPVFPMEWRAVVKPLHVGLGIIIFVLAIGTAFAGITEKLIWTLGSEYSKLVPEAAVANTLGLMLAGVTALIVYIVSNAAYVRRPLAID